MHFFQRFGLGLTNFGPTFISGEALNKVVQRDSTCTNGAGSRQCWDESHDISDNYYTLTPDTGKIVTYTFEATSKMLSPDGVRREMMVFNGQYPGPTIMARWGDTIEVTIKNSLSSNGTSVHWHGIHQLESNDMDGASGLTECPIAPGHNKTYKFKAAQYSTSWYHAHDSFQIGEGLQGLIIIHGPSTADYDIDLGALPMTDWWRVPQYRIQALKSPVPPTSDSLLVNGSGAFNGTGHYGTTAITPGKKNKLRLINTSTSVYLNVGLDQHSFTVVSVDFVPIEPFITSTLSLAMGQRFDVIIDANQTISSYWFRVRTGGGRCDAPNRKAHSNDTRGSIFRYIGADANEPRSKETSIGTECVEVPTMPYHRLAVPASDAPPTTLDITLDTNQGVLWKVNDKPIKVDWGNPSLQIIINGTYHLPAQSNSLTILAESWTFWLIRNKTPLPHSLHLHGHDAYILSRGQGLGENAELNFTTPQRRDTFVVDAGGYVTIAIEAAKPGVWLMNSQQAFHASDGLGIQFLVRPTEILDTLRDLKGFNNDCAAWRDHQAKSGGNQTDSGL